MQGSLIWQLGASAARPYDFRAPGASGTLLPRRRDDRLGALVRSMAVDGEHGVHDADDPDDEAEMREDDRDHQHERRDIEHEIQDRLEPLPDHQQRQRRAEDGEEIEHDRQCTAARCVAAISARLPKWKSGVVTAAGTGVAPKPACPRRRSIQAVASPSDFATPMSWYWLCAVCRMSCRRTPPALSRPRA